MIDNKLFDLRIVQCCPLRLQPEQHLKWTPQTEVVTRISRYLVTDLHMIKLCYLFVVDTLKISTNFFIVPGAGRGRGREKEVPASCNSKTVHVEDTDMKFVWVGRKLSNNY